MGEEIIENNIDKHVIQGSKRCQTRDAKWLCLNNIYDHFQRPNLYDIGGTYIEEVADYWFMYKTEQVSQLYILHLFICNRQETSFIISVCTSNALNIFRNGTIQLNSYRKEFKFEGVQEQTHNYVTTYGFTELDVELMKDKKLLIGLTFNTTQTQEISIPTDYKILHDFSQLVTDPVGADFTIESGDGAKFQVHKFLLSARSEVFKAMLKDDTAESINNHVTITDIGKDDLSCLIEFLYTGTIKDLENNNCFNILMLADRYDLQGLKDLAQHVLAQQLTIENALEVLMASDLYNSPHLKTVAFKFIKTNVNSLENSIFQEIHNVQLLRDLCKYLAVKY